MRQSVPRWLSTDDAIIKAYLALVDKVCPCVMLLHSQGGAFGFKVAEQRPDKVKAIVAIESATAGIVANAPKLKDVPVLMLFGDYVDEHPRWSTFKKIDMEYGNAIKAAGGKVDWINLPEIGIKGNSHMLMQDKNSDQIAEVIQKWLVSQNLVDETPQSSTGRNSMRMMLTLIAALAASPALARQEPILLRDMGSFHIGGRHIEVKGQPVKEIVFTPGGVPAKVDPNGVYQVEQMYAQYFLVQNRKGKLPLLMWHGGGLSGVTYETKPDGNPGWLNYFLRKGWDTYVSDAMERGRSGWTDKFKGDPVFLPLGDPWERFRVGPLGSWNDDKASARPIRACNSRPRPMSSS